MRLRHAPFLLLPLAAAAAAALYLTDLTPPLVALELPGGEGGQSSSLPVRLEVSDEGGGPYLAGYELRRPDGVAVLSEPPAPYAAAHELLIPPGAPFGRYTIVARVSDRAGNVGSTSAVYEYRAAARSSRSLEPAYELEASLDLAAPRVEGLLTVTLVNRDADAIDHLDFAVPALADGELVIDSATVDRRPGKTSTPRSDLLRLELGENLEPGASAVIRIAFRAAPGDDIGDARAARLAESDGLLVLGGWYPLLADERIRSGPGATAVPIRGDISATITYPEGVRLVAPGTVSTGEGGDGTRRARIHLPDAAELALVAGSDLLLSRAKADLPGGRSVSIEAYGVEGVDRVAALAAAKTALETMGARYGPPGFDRYVIVAGPRRNGLAEYPGLLVLGAELMDGRFVIARETARQWFGELVGSDALAAPWLEEAFAEYLGRRIAKIAMPRFCSSYPVDSPAETWPDGPGEDRCGSYAQTVARKGAVMLAGLEELFGQRRFDRALRAVVAERRGLSISEEQLVGVLRRYAPDETTFERYLYPGYLLP